MNTERPKPYIGVSGVTRYKNVQPSGLVVNEPRQLFVEAYADRAGIKDTDRRLALGVKAMHVTQFQDRVSKKGRDWQPVGAEEFGEALAPKEKYPNTMGVAQMYLDVNHVMNSEYRKVFMRRVMARGSLWLTDVQFDVLPWHTNNDMPDFIEKFKNDYPETGIILQAPLRFIDELGVDEAFDKLGDYEGLADYILFDGSLGKGLPIDVDVMDDLLYRAYSSAKLDSMNFAVAGGLDADEVRSKLPYLLLEYPDISWDSEGKLHPLNNVGTRPLQLDTTREYIDASVEVIKNSPYN